MAGLSSNDGDMQNTTPVVGTPDDSDEFKKREENNAISYHKLFSFADSTDYILMVVGTITAMASGLSLPLQTVILGELVNTFGQNTDTQQIARLVSRVALKYVYLALGSGIAAFSQVACWTVTGERQAARIRALYLKSLLRQDVGYYDQGSNTGEIVERMSGDTVIIQDAMGEKVGKFIQLASTFVGGFVIAFVKGWLLSLVLLSSIPLLSIAASCLAMFMVKLNSLSQVAYSSGATVVDQTVGSIRTVVSFTGEREAIAKYDKSLHKAYLSGVQEGLATGVGGGVFFLVIFSTWALAVWFGGKLIIEKGYTGGEVLNVILSILVSSFSLGQASPCLTTFTAGKVAASKMFQTLDRKSKIDPYDTNGRVLNDIKGDVEVKDVCFSYPSRPEEQVFNGFSLYIPSGTTAALVGQSGSGKSTIISLIDRFYDPQQGQVLIDDINVKEYQLRWLRGKIGLVSQEPVLFTCSIKDNIAYGKDGATLDEIKSATELANAANFINQLPQGLDTMVGVHGTQLSGGQKQRIAIARAILKDPRILLLDEATSALDAESERIVQEALDRVMSNRTTVVVAHRLSTIKNADIIAVIHQGKTVEKGSHSELLENPQGAYSQLIRLQQFPEQRQVTNQEITDPERTVVSGTGNSSSSHHSLSVSVFSDDQGPNKKKESDVSLVRLAYLNKPELPVLLLGSVAAVVNGAINPVLGLLMSSIIKTFFEPPHKLKKESEFWALMFLGLGFTAFVAIPLRSYLFGIAGCKLIRRIRLMCFERVVQMEISWFDKAENSSGAIGTRLSVDAASVRGLLGDTLALLVQNTATAVAGLAISFAACWQLAVIVVFMIPFIGLNGYIHVKSLTGLGIDTKKQYEDASQVATDAVGSIRTVASFCAEEKVMQLYQKKCKGPARKGMRQGLISGFGFGLSMFLLYLAYATSFYAGARLVAAGKTTFPNVFMVFFGLSLAAVAISQAGSVAPDTGRAKAASASVFALLDQKSKIDYTDESGTSLEDFKGDIVFSNVIFRYPTRPDVQIFRDLCLNIKSGKTVALVGESGSGKSTLISLLQRFYDPDSGQIMLDGVEIQKLRVKWVRQQMGVVSQEPVLFNETIRANISYGKEGNATEAEIIAAAELANAHKFISGLQKGYDTKVGERGIQLSGGQKQRVAIARAMIKGPKILLLDEATSALDAESEKVVQDALDRVMVDRTTVVVAHRLSTIKGADVIAVVKDGAISEKGKHEDLMNIKGGIYASLAAAAAAAESCSSFPYQYTPALQLGNGLVQ